MKQKLKLELNGNRVESKTEYIYTPDTEVELDKLNFGQGDVIIKNNGIQEGAFVLQCVNMLVKPPTLNEVRVPIKFPNGIEQAFDELFVECDKQKKRIEELEKIVGTLVDNLEG